MRYALQIKILRNEIDKIYAQGPCVTDLLKFIIAALPKIHGKTEGATVLRKEAEANTKSFPAEANSTSADIKSLESLVMVI